MFIALPIVRLLILEMGVNVEIDSNKLWQFFDHVYTLRLFM